MMIKVVYFDESSATDFIYISSGGKSEGTKEEIVKKTNKLAANAAAKAEAKFKFFSLFDSSAGVGASGDISREGDSILKKAVSTTILTDYLALANSKTMSKYIVQFSDVVLYPYPDSFAYIKMITPYMAMAEGGVKVGEDLNLNIALMDKVFEGARGYYELIMYDNGIKNVLRFNIKAFRNNYGISDLVKMKLHYYAVEVGEVHESSLAMKSEFTPSETNISGYDILEGKSGDMLKVFDVVLAGVKK